MRRVTIVATVLLCLLAADYLVRAKAGLLDLYYHSYIQRKINTLTGENPTRHVVCIGSSRAAYAFVPAEFERLTGAAAFNCGIPATKVLEWQLTTERWIAPLSPDLLVLAVNASEIRADYVPVTAARELFGVSDMIQYTLNDGWSPFVAGHFLDRNAGAFWALYHRRFEILKYLQERGRFAFPKYAQIARERLMIATRICPADGFEHPWEADRQMMTLAEQEVVSPESILAASIPEFSPDAPAVGHFRDFLAWLNARQIRVIVAYLPNSPRTERRWGRVEVQLESTIADCCREADIPYVSASMVELPRTDADYFDETHMGTGLARRITRRVAERAMALGYFKPRPHDCIASANHSSQADDSAAVERLIDSSLSDSKAAPIQFDSQCDEGTSNP